MSNLSFIGYDPAHAARVRASIPANAVHPADVRVFAEELRRVCKIKKWNLGLAWAQCWHETNGFASDLWRTRRNPAGIKSESGASYMRYYNGVDAARAYLSHLGAYLPGYDGANATCNIVLDPRWHIARERAWLTPFSQRPLLTVVARSWAEDDDYAAKVEGWYARLIDPPRDLWPVLLVAGHRNLDGGNPAERDRTDDLARAYLAECRARGIRADWLQAIDGDSDPDDTLDGLWGVAMRCNDWLSRQSFGVMLDLHFEGGGSPGAFAVYPDWPGDTGNDLDRRAAGMIAAEIARATGLGVRQVGVTSPGAMSERQTGVGAQGYRLGMFNLTSSQREKSIRLVIEHGSLDKQPDAGIINADLAAFARKAARAAVDALMDLQGGVR